MVESDRAEQVDDHDDEVEDDLDYGDGDSGDANV